MQRAEIQELKNRVINNENVFNDEIAGNLKNLSHLHVTELNKQKNNYED